MLKQCIDDVWMKWRMDDLIRQQFFWMSEKVRECYHDIANDEMPILFDDGNAC